MKNQPIRSVKTYQEHARRNYNPFAHLMNNIIKFYKCHNFGCKENECRIKLYMVKRNSNLQPSGQKGLGIWRNKLDHIEGE